MLLLFCTRYSKMSWGNIGIINKTVKTPFSRTVSIQNTYPIGGKYGTYK